MGCSWKGLGSSSGALGDALAMETLYFRKMKVSPRWEHDFEKLETRDEKREAREESGETKDVRLKIRNRRIETRD